MNLIDPLLQRQYPNNALLMTVSSIGVLFSSIQIVFVHMDQLLFVGVASLLVNLETFFAAYNFSYKGMRFLFLLHLLLLIANVVIGLFLILLQETHCSVATNHLECRAISTIYGFSILIGGSILYGLSLVLAYYFCRLFPTEKGGIPFVNPHPFTEADTLKRVEEYDNMKKPTDLSPSLNPSLSSSFVL